MAKKRIDDSSYIHTENEETVLLKVKTVTTNFGDERRSEAVIASFKDRHKRRKVITSPNNIVHKGRQACMKVTKYLTTDGFVLISTPSAIVDGIRTFVVDEKLIAGPCEKWTPQTEEEEEVPEISQPSKIKKPKAELGTVWDKPKLKRLLKQPLGSPVELSQEEADRVVKEAAGSWKRGRPKGSKNKPKGK